MIFSIVDKRVSYALFINFTPKFLNYGVEPCLCRVKLLSARVCEKKYKKKCVRCGMGGTVGYGAILCDTMRYGAEFFKDSLKLFNIYSVSSVNELPTESNQILPKPTEVYRSLPKSTEVHRILPNPNEPYQILPNQEKLWIIIRSRL